MAELDITDPELDGFDRGFPAAAAGVRCSEVGAQEWDLHAHMSTPIAVIAEDRLRHNAEVMQAWCRSHGAELWPHAKTTMSAQLIDRQRRTGASGVTAASAAQARLLVAWGAPAVLVANQLVEPRALADVLAAVVEAESELTCFVDSIAGVEILERQAAAVGVHMPVLLEVGAPGARTGVRTASDRDGVLAALARSAHVRLIGVAGYEGAFAADRSTESLARVDSYLSGIVEVLEELVRRGVVESDRPVLSAGGSMYFDRVVTASQSMRGGHRLVLRSGCYLLHDAGLFQHATPLPDEPSRPGLRAALTVWGTVHSRPEAGRAYLDVGRRDVGEDQGLPLVQRRLAAGAAEPAPLEGVRVIALNDQHCHLEVDPGALLEVGDRIELGVSHPCTTMDKWRTVPLVSGRTLVGAITTRF
ncbi:alanine racemase [Pseudactinotalea sp.]|uniref:alanine racemase n=1 Tax=Pseudactinotalea sp. TaxID=1926260 RepID=UPI003B3A6567